MDPFSKDTSFLEAFRQGQAVALDRVYRYFERPLRNFILRGFAFKSEGRQLYFKGLFAEHDLEDIVQETFRRAFGAKARAAYDGIRPYKNYLFTIARNAVITDLALKRRQIPVGEALMRDAPSDDLSPLESWVVAQRALMADQEDITSESRLENLEIYGLLASFMEILTPDEDRFFRLRFLGQNSQEQTARHLGWNRARVRKLESRLRRAFVCQLKDSGYLECREECRMVRRVDDPIQYQALVDRSRAIWRAHNTQNVPEIWEAAA